MEKQKLPAKSAMNLLDSTALMNSQYGITFNSMITLNFEQAGIHDQEEKSTKFEKLNKSIARHFRQFDRKWKLGGAHPFCYIYVHEFVQSQGHHVHQLVAMHKGIHATFEKFLAGWAKRNLPAEAEPNALHYRGFDFPRLTTRIENQAMLVSYILKSVEDKCAPDSKGEPRSLREVLDLHHRQRCYLADVPRPAGSSQNISWKAQGLAFERYEFDTYPIDRLLSDDHVKAFRQRQQNKEFVASLRKWDD